LCGEQRASRFSSSARQTSARTRATTQSSRVTRRGTPLEVLRSVCPVGRSDGLIPRSRSVVNARQGVPTPARCARATMSPNTGVRLRPAGRTVVVVLAHTNRLKSDSLPSSRPEIERAHGPTASSGPVAGGSFPEKCVDARQSLELVGLQVGVEQLVKLLARCVLCHWVTPTVGCGSSTRADADPPRLLPGVRNRSRGSRSISRPWCRMHRPGRFGASRRPRW
jgi:hypothetical protein